MKSKYLYLSILLMAITLYSCGSEQSTSHRTDPSTADGVAATPTPAASQGGKQANSAAASKNTGASTNSAEHEEDEHEECLALAEENGYDLHTCDAEPAPTSAPVSPGTSPTPLPEMKLVEFRIKAGTANASWNTKETMIIVKVGQTLRLVNDDTVAHRLHTNGAPCDHGDAFGPGKTFDCVISKAFDPGTKPLYDHGAGTTAEFWLKALP